MRSQEEFDQFYQNDLKPTLEELEKIRKGIANKIFLLGGGTIMLSGLSYLLFQHIAAPIIIAIIGIGVTWWLTNKPAQNFYSQFKSNVIKTLVHFINPELNYNSLRSISKGTFYESQIFQKGVDRYNGDDYISGIIDKTDIEFSEVHAEYKTTTTDSKGRRQTHWHTIFKGLFFSADFNKDFHGETFVLPDFAQGLFGKFGQTLQSWGKSHGELVKLEDIEFEKAFVCYSNDQTEARYILSPALMEKILHLKTKVNRQIHLSFIASRVYVAISYQKDLFEASIFSKLDQKHKIQEFFNDLNLALGIVEDLNLNTRIWTKS
jgi:hypothetical protein